MPLDVGVFGRVVVKTASTDAICIEK